MKNLSKFQRQETATPTVLYEVENYARGREYRNDQHSISGNGGEGHIQSVQPNPPPYALPLQFSMDTVTFSVLSGEWPEQQPGGDWQCLSKVPPHQWTGTFPKYLHKPTRATFLGGPRPQLVQASLSAMINPDNSGPVHSQSDLAVAISRVRRLAEQLLPGASLDDRPERLDFNCHLPYPAAQVTTAFLQSTHPGIKAATVYPEPCNVLLRGKGWSLTVYDKLFWEKGIRSAWCRVELRLIYNQLEEFIRAGGWPDISRCYERLREALLSFSGLQLDILRYIPPTLETFLAQPIPALSYSPMDSLPWHVLQVLEGKRKSPLREPVRNPQRARR